MSVQTQIDRISGAVQSALAALTEKGVTVPSGTKVDGLAALIAAIEAGGVNIATGSFTPAADTTFYNIEHNLNKPPRAIFVYLDSVPDAWTVGDGVGVAECNEGVTSYPVTNCRGFYVYTKDSKGTISISQKNSSVYYSENDMLSVDKISQPSKNPDGDGMGKIVFNKKYFAIYTKSSNKYGGFRPNYTYIWIVIA